jgi:hypothetical protein
MKLTDDIRQMIKAHLTTCPKASTHENVYVLRSAGAWVKPHPSDALGVDPADVPKAMAHLRSNGVAADFDSEGRCLVTSDKQFREIAKASGMWDGRDGFCVRDHEGKQILSGRQQVEARTALRRAIERDEFAI